MAKLRCAVLDDYQQVALASADWSPILNAVQIDVFERHFESADALTAALRGHHVIVAMRERTAFPAPVLSRLPALRLLVTTGMRNAAIDLSAADGLGITVCGTSSASEPAAELTWALILALARSIVQESDAFRRGGWQGTVGADLKGATLGVLGLGRIGSQVAAIGRAFGMHVHAWSQNLTEARALAAGVQLAPSKDVLFDASDFVSIHLVLSERTRGVVGASELRRMRRTAYLVNTSRAAIVDTPALITALREGWIAGAGIDVFDREPLPADDPLRTLPTVVATPHLGYVTRGNYARYFHEVVEDIAAFLGGSPVRVLNSPERGRLHTRQGS
jgi:phosphoglycerate dehydrogenase-like enzyme